MMKFEEEKMEMEAASQSSSSQVTAQHAPPSLGVAVVGRAPPDAAAAAPPPPPVADAWQRAWRALVPQWNQVRGSLKVYLLDSAPRSRSWFSS